MDLSGNYYYTYREPQDDSLAAIDERARLNNTPTDEWIAERIDYVRNALSVRRRVVVTLKWPSSTFPPGGPGATYEVKAENWQHSNQFGSHEIIVLVANGIMEPV